MDSGFPKPEGPIKTPEHAKLNEVRNGIYMMLIIKGVPQTTAKDMMMQLDEAWLAWARVAFASLTPGVQPGSPVVEESKEEPISSRLLRAVKAAIEAECLKNHIQVEFEDLQGGFALLQMKFTKPEVKRDWRETLYLREVMEKRMIKDGAINAEEIVDYAYFTVNLVSDSIRLYLKDKPNEEVPV